MNLSRRSFLVGSLISAVPAIYRESIARDVERMSDYDGGYVKIPNGDLVLQWGRFELSDKPETHAVFPLKFNKYGARIVAAPRGDGMVFISSVSLDRFSVGRTLETVGTVDWAALG